MGKEFNMKFLKYIFWDSQPTLVDKVTIIALGTMAACVWGNIAVIGLVSFFK